jgi:uncharacterized protein YjbI with pentapeptide repeats
MAEKIDPFDVKALEGSLNDSATRVSTIWISFVLFALYVVIAAGTVTHRQLFLEEPVKLPVLNIDLPMVGFFFLAPVLFVVFHVYVLLQVLLLGRTAAAYNAALNRAVKPPPGNASMRQHLANTLFAQIFAGSPREREGWLGVLLQMMAWLTLAVAPVLVLLVFQFQFLPYHSHFVTWALRILIVLDLVAVVVLWPALRDPDRDVSLRVILRRWIALPFGLGLVALSWIFLTFPGEWHAKWTRYGGQEEVSDSIDPIKCWMTVSPMSKVFSSFDRLDLRRVDVIDHEKLKSIEAHTKSDGLPDYEGERTRKIRDRNLDCADFSDSSDLRRVDLTDSSLRGASLLSARLQGVSLFHAHLQGADLREAHLQGANLSYAELQGAFLWQAQLQGADLRKAQLQGASPGEAQLQGAFLREANLQGANLSGAELQGANLVEAKLHGANLQEAKLQGADLWGAELQGADFKNSSLELGDFTKSSVWRARNATCNGARVAEIDHRGIGYVADLINDALKDVARGPSRTITAERMRASLVVDSAQDDTAAIAKVWTQCAEASKYVSPADFEKQLGLFLRDVVCEAKENREAVATGIIRNWISDEPERLAFSTQLARGLLGEEGKPCATTKDLSEKTKDRLRSFLPAPATNKGRSSL